MTDEKRITHDLQIHTYFACKLCLDEKPDEVSPAAWSRNEIGWTQYGVQVWCRRHDCNVINIDFEGHRHHAIAKRKEEPPDGVEP